MVNIFRHFIFTVLSNVGPLAFGLHLGWLGPFVVEMMGEGEANNRTSPYSAPLTHSQISWLGSLISASMLVATPFYGLLLQYSSYKPLTVFSNILHCLAFGLYIVPNIDVAYAARFIAGFASVGSIVITPLYVNECVKPSYRGFLGALCSLSITMGVAIAYVAGSFTTFLITNIVCLSCALLFFLGLFWIPDSPVSLVMKKNYPAAEKSLLKLRCANNEDAAYEITLIQEEVGAHSSEQSASLLQILGDKAMRNSMLLAMGMMITQQGTGIAPMQFYYELVLISDSNSSPGPFVAPTIAAVQLLASVAGAFLLSFAGRKRILVATTIMISAIYTVLWLLIDNNINSPVLRILATISYFASYNVGIGTVPFVMLPEILPQRARAVSVAVAGLITGLVSFLYAKLFPIFIEMYHLKYAILFFAATSCLGASFIVLCLFETKGKSAAEIYECLGGDKSVKRRSVLSANSPILESTTITGC